MRARVTLMHDGREATLTTAHPASSDGLPVLLIDGDEVPRTNAEVDQIIHDERLPDEDEARLDYLPDISAPLDPEREARFADMLAAVTRWNDQVERRHSGACLHPQGAAE